MLIVWSQRVDSQAFIYTIPQVEKTEKEISSRTRKRKYEMVTPDWKKMVDGLTKRWKSGGTINKVFKKYGNRSKRRGKGEKIRIWI